MQASRAGERVQTLVSLYIFAGGLCRKTLGTMDKGNSIWGGFAIMAPSKTFCFPVDSLSWKCERAS
jgi:hypothetical protein